MIHSLLWLLLLKAWLKTKKNECKTVDELRQVFKNTSEEFTNDEQFELMTKKGVYPYDYITSFDKLNDTKLPPQNAFYSKLSNKKCSNEDYQQDKKVGILLTVKHF